MLTRAAFSEGRGPIISGDPSTQSGVSDTWAAIAATFVVFAVAFGAGWWVADKVSFGLIVVAALAGLGIAIFTAVKPTTAPVTAPLYAVVEGIFVGGLSRYYEVQYDGIVLQAGILTAAVYAGMWFMYATGRLRLTPKLQKIIITSTMAIAATYLISFVLGLFGGEVPFIHDSGPIGIGISLVIVGIASLNLLLDFDYIDRLNSQPHERWQDWFAAMGLLITVVWIYIELLRLISKLRD
jgi:uncharacterized YccA/Bax inhibitor family protein